MGYSVNESRKESKSVYTISQEDSGHYETVDALLNAIFDGLPDNSVGLEIHFDNSIALSEENWNYIKEQLDKNGCLKDIQFDFKKELDADSFDKKVQEYASVIMARNQIIELYSIDTTQENFDPWYSCMLEHINKNNALIFDVPAIDWFGTSKVNDKLNALGAIGLSHFFQTIYQVISDRKPNEKKINTLCTKFHYSYNKGGVTLSDFFATLNAVQAKQNGKPIPFLEFQVHSDEVVQVDKEGIDQIITFLKNNRHVTFMELLNDHATKNIFENFTGQLQKNEITTKCRIYGDNDSEETEHFNQILDAIYIDNIKKIENIELPKIEILGVESIVPKFWQAPRKKNKKNQANIQVETSVTTESSQQTQSDCSQSMATERGQQIQQQQNRRNELDALLLKKVTYLNLNDTYFKAEDFTNGAIKGKRKFQNPIKYLSDDEKQTLLKDLKGSIMGDKIARLDYVSEFAMEQILMYPHAFANGLMFHNLPSGFYIHETEQHERYLCYNLSFVRPDITPLTAPLLTNKNQFLTERHYEKFIPEGSLPSNKQMSALRSAVTKIFRGSVDNNYLPTDGETKAIIAAYQFLINTHNGSSDFAEKYAPIIKKLGSAEWLCMRSILSEHGVEKFCLFLDSLMALEHKGLFDCFQKAFINKQKNLINFIKEEAQYNTCIQSLLQLSSNQAEWWINLVNQQALVSGYSDLFSMKEAFDYFIKEVDKLAPGVELPQPCQIKNAHNLYVTLDRILYILKSAADVKEQLYNLAGVSLDSEGAFHAISQDNFYFVSKEMALENDKPSKVQPFSYRVDPGDLATKAVELRDDSFYKCYYRYLGGQQYTLPFAYYRDLFKKIYESTLTAAEKNKVLALVAFSSSGVKALNILPTAHCEALLKLLISLSPEQREHLLMIFIHIISTGAELTLDECVSIAAFYQNQFPNLTKDKFREYLDTYHPSSAAIHSFIVLAERNEKNRISWTEFENKIASIPSTIALQFAVLMDKEALAQYNFQNFNISKTNRDTFFATCRQIDAQQTPAFLSSEAVSNLQNELNAHENCSEKDIKLSFKEHAPQLSWCIENLAVMAQQSTEDLIELLASEAFSGAYDELKKQIPSLPEKQDIIANINEQKLTVDQFLEQIRDGLQSFAFFLEGPFKSKFFSICENYLGGLLSTSAIETTQKDLLLQALFNYLGRDTATFFNNFNRVKHFIKTFNQQQQKQHYAFLETVITRLSQDIPFEEKSQQIDIAVYLLKNKVLSSTAKTTILQSFPVTHILGSEQIRTFIDNHANIFEKSDHLSSALCAQLSNEGADFEQKLVYVSRLKQFIANIAEENRDGLIYLLQNTKLQTFFETLDKIQDRAPAFYTLFFKSLLNDDLTQLSNQIGTLLALDNDNLEKIARLYVRRPYPSLSRLHTASVTNDNIDLFIQQFNANPFSNRNIETQVQFEQQQKNTISKRLLHPTQGGSRGVRAAPFSKTEINKKIAAIETINRMSKDFHKLHPDILREGFKWLQQQFPKLEFAKVDTDNNDPLCDIKAAFNTSKDARLCAMAIMRELFYRTSKDTNSPIWLNETQLMTILDMQESTGNIMADVQTGQGKTYITAGNAIMQFFEGKRADVCSFSNDMAKRDIDKLADVFDSLGIRARYADENSNNSDYNDSDIVYISVASLSLLRQRLLLEKTYKPGDKPITLVLDEADAILLNSATSIYVLSQGTTDGSDPHVNPDAWIYDHVNDFIDALDNNDINSPLLKYLNQYGDPPYTINQEVSALLAYLGDKAEPGKQQERLSEKGFKKQLNLWIDSAWMAKDLVLGQDYMLVENRAVILAQNRPIPKARWSNGVHQLLHSRLNAEQRKQNKEANFVIESERKGISTENSRQFCEFYTKRGGRLLVSTGSPGSTAEKIELAEKYGLTFLAYPTHEERQRQIDKDVFVEDLDALAKKLVADTRGLKGQPILIQVGDIETAKNLQVKMQQYQNGKHYSKNRIQCLTAENIDEISTIEGLGSQDGYITISTMSDRGSDIRPKGTFGRKYGLYANSIDLTNTREEEQRKGRVSRQTDPGRFRRIFMFNSFKKQFGIDLKKLDSQKRKNVIDRQQMLLDFKQEEQRVLNERKQRIQNTVMEPFQKLYDACEDPNKLKKLNELRVNLLNELNTLWHDGYHSDFGFEKELDKNNRDVAFRQRLNQRTKRYIKRTNLAWKRCCEKELQPLLGEENIAGITNIDVKTTLQEQRKDMKSKISYDPAQKGFALEKFESLVHMNNLAHINKLKNYTIRLLKDPGLSEEWKKIQAYNANELNKTTHMRKIFALTKNTYQDYKKKRGVAKDRIDAFDALFKQDKKSFNKEVTTLPSLLKQLNTIILQTTQEDLKREQSIFTRRKLSSRLRDRLSDIKVVVLAMLDKEAIKKVLSEELAHQLALIEQECLRQHTPAVQAQLENLRDILKASGDTLEAQKICLQKSITQVRILMQNPKFNLHNSTLNYSEKDLGFLYRLVQRPGKNFHNQSTMQDILSTTIARFKWPEVPKKFLFFDNKPLIEDKDVRVSFQSVLSQFKSPKEKFMVYHVLDNITKKIGDLGAFDIVMTKNIHSDHIQIAFSYLKEQSLLPVTFSFDLQMNLKEQTLEIRPSEQSSYAIDKGIQP